MDSARHAVWIAMSDLFLDTDVRLWYTYIARVCAESPFSQEELERIFRTEVAPVLEDNLHQIAGDWAGFNNEWVIRSISNRKPEELPAESLATNDYRAVAMLVERLRALWPEARAERLAAWNALAPLFLNKDPKRPEVLPDESILRLDMMPSFGGDPASVEAAWRKWCDS